MIKCSRQVVKRLAMVLCALLIGKGFSNTIMAYDDWTAKEGYIPTISFTSSCSQIDYGLSIRPIITTGSAVETIPTTTPQSIDVRFYADQAIVEATTESMIQVNIEVGNIEQVNMFEVQMTYDTNQLIYIEETLPLEGSLLVNKQVKDGTIQIQFETLKEQELQNNKKIIQMRFITRDNLQANERIIIKLNQCDVTTINELNESKLYRGIIEPKVLIIHVIEASPTADINKDGKVNLEDLAIAIKYYGIDHTQTIWEKAKKCDVIPDDKIDMEDLIKISSLHISFY